MAAEPSSLPTHTEHAPESLDSPSAADQPDATRATSSEADSSIEQNEVPVVGLDEQTSIEVSHGEGSSHAMFSETEDAGDAWLVSEEASPPQEAPQETNVEDPSSTQEPESPITDAKPTNPVSQHSSSMSFARTVSHEPSFNDDDEGDWDLSRRDTDPFKFMPPTERTNSFPVVPPIASNADSRDAPLPSNQAMDVLEETEKDVHDEEEQYSFSPAPAETTSPLNDSGTGPKRKHAHSQSIGGDIKGSEALESDSRYEEGIPLIPRNGMNEQGVPRHEESPGALQSSFDDEKGKEEDYFSHVGQDNGDVPQSSHTLERKSTMQVLDGIEPGQNSTALERTLEEENENSSSDEKSEPKEPGVLAEPEPAGEDIAAKWEEAFADDDEDDGFLLDDNAAESKEVDPAAFFGSDDEGFLEDVEEPKPAPQPQPVSSNRGPNSYVPNQATTQQLASYVTPVLPNSTSIPAASNSIYTPSVPTTPFTAEPQQGSVLRPNQDASRAQSFADKSKGGYHSPYDLPTDLVTTFVKPRKRASMQQLPQSSSHLSLGPPPPRSASATIRSPGLPQDSVSPPSSSHGSQPQHPQQHASTPALRSKDSFFEELPMTSRPRPSSRTSHRTASPAPQFPPMHSPHVPSPLMPPSAQQMPPPPPPASAPLPQQPASHQPAIGGNLVAPERVSPYAPLQSQTSSMTVPSTTSSRYSPAPTAGSGSHIVPPVSASSRYSPAPPAGKAHGPYGAVGASGVPPPILAHQPRTSSPLTHYEINHDKLAHGGSGEPSLSERRASSSFGHGLSRVSSLPPTREVDEEEDQDVQQSRSLSATHAPPAESRYSPAPSPSAVPQTAPLPSYSKQATLSPPKKMGSAYVPQAPPSAQSGFVPPPRAQTQSPSAVYGNRASKNSPSDARRPSSAHSPASPIMAKPMHTAYAPSARPRGPSLTMNMVPPTDGREQDPLQRWKGAPIITWGVGGTMVTSFPNSVPRYGMNQVAPSIIRTPGEVKVRNIKDIEPLQERLAKFPGPLKGKSKKKETLAWLDAGIETLEKDLPDVSFHSQLSLEAKRSIERLLLWKILRVFIEFDGTLEGNEAVEKAVRGILAPGTITPTADDDALFPGSPGAGAEMSAVTSMQVDSADAAAVEQIRHYLFKGQSEKAVWACADKRLWGHAMLISHTISADLYKQVAQEFIRKEVNHTGHNNESLAALYKVLSGNYDDCVDELVPVHAQLGRELVSTGPTSGPTKATLDGLDKWRETLYLILSNRSVDDIRGLNALGSLLSRYGRAEAAHICFVFGRNASVFGGLDDRSANFVLLGSDHHQQSEQFAKETEALQLSEVYEYGLSLAGGIAAAAGIPHLAAYKLQHAMTLAEYGYRDKALQYCDAIATAIHSQTKRSPYHNLILEAAVDDFMIRLKQAPKGETNSWISKPSMNKVSDSMWNRFNKFVAGDDGENNGANAAGDVDSGPFGRITTPTMSRSPSVNNFEAYGTASPSYMSQPLNAASSRYAPAAPSAAANSNPYEPTSQYTPGPRVSNERSSGEYQRGSYEPSYPGVSPPSAQANSFTPLTKLASEAGYQSDAGPTAGPALASPASIIPAPYGTGRPHALQNSASMPSFSMVHQSNPSDTASQGYQPPVYGYEPPQMNSTTSEPENNESSTEDNAGGYQPPSFQPYGYEPPSYQPDPVPSAEDEDEPKPKKKSFMDDDDDDIPALRDGGKTKAEKDRENEEMFRKAAEEDGESDDLVT